MKRQVIWCFAKASGLAFLAQFVVVVLTFVFAPRMFATHAVMYFYYPAVLFVKATYIGHSLPIAVCVVIWIPSLGAAFYSLVIGVLWAAMGSHPEGKRE